MLNENNQNKQDNNNNPNSPKGPRIAPMLIAALVVLLIVSYFTRALTSATTKEINYNEFIEMLDSGKVASVFLDKDKIMVTPTEEIVTSPYMARMTITYVCGYVEPSDQLAERLLASGVEISGEIPDNSSWLISIILTYILPIVLFFVLISFLSNRMGGGAGGFLGGVGKSNAKVYVQKETGVTFKDVAGENEAKESLVEVVDFLHNPGRYTKIGAKLPKGALLVGPPGTGKTLLARAVAGEAHVPFFSLTGSDFVEMFVGVGASRVRDLFDQAKKNAPCIVFIDEIDAVGRQRGAGVGGGHDEREQTLNQLLVEMDGFGINEGIIMIAATNRPDILDHALLRPGRFDRQIVVDRPDMRGREAILNVHAKGKPMAPDVDMTTIAKQTTGFTGADLANLVNEAALLTARRNVPMIDMKAMNEAAERVVMGPERRSHLVSEPEKKLTAYHETGHTLIGLLHNDVSVVHKVTIIPRGRAGGYTMSLPKEDRNYQTKSEMLDELQMLLGGRVAEAIVLKDISSGASSDLQRATELARKMVCQYGMSDRLGSMTFGHPEEEVFLGRDIAREKYSNEVAAVIDEEVRRLMDEAYKGAEKLLQENMDKLVLIAETLMQKETLDGRQLQELMNQGYLAEDGPALQAAEQPAGEPG